MPGLARVWNRLWTRNHYESLLSVVSLPHVYTRAIQLCRLHHWSLTERALTFLGDILNSTNSAVTNSSSAAVHARHYTRTLPN